MSIVDERMRELDGSVEREDSALRDWFAGLALTAILRAYEHPDYFEENDERVIRPKEEAEKAYRLADAMMAERARYYGK